VSARLVRSALVLGRHVQLGEVLVELNSEGLDLERKGEMDRLGALTPQIEALQKEVASHRQALRGEGRVSKAQRKEALALLRASIVMALQKASEKKQFQKLSDQKMIANLERDRRQADSAQQNAETDAAREHVDRIDSEGAVKKSEREALIASLELAEARLKSERTDALGKVRILDQKIDLHVIRAPVSGRIGHMVNLRAGAMVGERDRLCTIVPTGDLHAVAFFDPATAAGRVHTGQSARLRMFGFPWTKYGMLEAQVDRVGNEPKDGLIRVELRLRSPQKTSIPLEHGLPGSAEVEVERISPFALVLDAAGRFLMTAQQPAEPVAAPPAPVVDK
jgi:membrane fusion protein (multidrug efflux system)